MTGNPTAGSSGAGWPTGRARDGGIDEIPLPGPAAAGRLWLCGKHAIGPDVEGLLARVGADGVVCLTERDELIHRYPEYVAWLDRDERALWRPVHDLSAPPLAAFTEVVEHVHAGMCAGRSLVVHCGAGIGRAGTLAVGVALRDGMPLDRALAHVAAHRPMAGPEVGEQQHLVDVFAARCAASGGGPPAGALRESHPWDPSRDPQRRGSGDGAR